MSDGGLESIKAKPQEIDRIRAATRFAFFLCFCGYETPTQDPRDCLVFTRAYSESQLRACVFESKVFIEN